MFKQALKYSAVLVALYLGVAHGPAVVSEAKAIFAGGDATVKTFQGR